MSASPIATIPLHPEDPEDIIHDDFQHEDHSEETVSRVVRTDAVPRPPTGFARGEVVDAESLLPPDDYFIFGYGSLIWKPNFKYVERRIAYLPKYERRCYQSSPDHRGTPTHEGLVVTVLPCGHPDLQYTTYPDVPPILPPPESNSTEATSPFDEVFADDALNAYDNRERCWGVVYRIAKEDITEVVSYLDFREQCGYTCLVETVMTLKPTITDTNTRLGEHIDTLTGEQLDRTTSIRSDDVSLSVFTPGTVAPVKAVCWFATTDNPHYTGALVDEYIGERIAKCHGESGPNYEYVFNLEAALTQFGCVDPHISSVAQIARRYINDPTFEPFPITPCEKIHAARSQAVCPSASSSRSSSSSPQSRSSTVQDPEIVHCHPEPLVCGGGGRRPSYTSQSNRVITHTHGGPSEHRMGTPLNATRKLQIASSSSQS